MHRLGGVVAALAVFLLSVPAGGIAAASDTIWTTVELGSRATHLRDEGDRGGDRPAAQHLLDGRRRLRLGTAVEQSRLKVGAGGLLTRIAGTGEAGFSGDGGPATAAQINFVDSASPTADGGYVLADTGNHRIRSSRRVAYHDGGRQRRAGLLGRRRAGDGRFDQRSAGRDRACRRVVSHSRLEQPSSPEGLSFGSDHHRRGHGSTGLQRRRRTGRRGDVLHSFRRRPYCGWRVPDRRRRKPAD